MKTTSFKKYCEIRYKRQVPGVLSLVCFLFAVLTIIIPNSPALATTIIDDSGQTISFEKPFSRIISLYPAHTENLVYLGAETAIVGISSSDDYPTRILDRKRFSYREDPEKFIAAQPDLVLVRPMIQRSYPEFIKKLKAVGITVVSLQPNNSDEMFGYWRTLGTLCGKQEAAEQMIEDFSSRLAKIKLAVETKYVGEYPKVYFEAIHTKMKTFAPDSIAALVLKTTGAINIGESAAQVRQTNIGYFGKEKLLSHGEEIDYYLAQVGRMNPVTVDLIANEPGFKAIKAVREGRIYLIEEQLVSRPTMRILEGIGKLTALFYDYEPATNNN